VPVRAYAEGERCLDVRVNVICPGAIQTNIGENTEQRDLKKEKEPVEFSHGNQPLEHGKPGSADQVAQLVLFLASDASIHISGTPSLLRFWKKGKVSTLHRSDK
jgi:NAD(P)-dependent dehydrogenase (short-subunit alcohol dehydrogenase family)